MNGGAVSYLTHSAYGRNQNEITANTSDNYLTGKALQSGYSVASYNTYYGMLASTTGNITGVYDMSGGAFEYVAAWSNKTGDDNVMNGSSFARPYENSTKYATAYAVYDPSVPNSDLCIVGDATYEVYVANSHAWFNDNSECVNWKNLHFARGGCYKSLYGGQGIFSAIASEGVANEAYSFRVSLPGV